MTLTASEAVLVTTDAFHMKDSEITITTASVIVQMTKALPEIKDGASPAVYEQVIPNPSSANQSGSPDPAHYG